MNLLVRIGTDLKSVMAPAVSRSRLDKHRVSVASSDNGLVGFNGVLAAHLLGVDAGHCQCAEIDLHHSTMGL